MMARLLDIRYRPGLEPVSVVVITPFGSQTIQTSQATLQQRADPLPWADAHVREVVQDALDALYPSAGLVVEGVDA